MGRLLFGIFLIVPIIEIGIFILVGQAIGLWPTLLGVVLTALIGSFVIRLQGISLIGEIQRMTAAGALPARQIADGVMLAIAGALLLTPGYFTDACGFLLLVPGVRSVIYQALKSRVSVVGGFQSTRTSGAQAGSGSDPFGNPYEDPDIVELEEENWRDK